jgi:hypothetical protein
MLEQLETHPPAPHQKMDTSNLTPAAKEILLKMITESNSAEAAEKHALIAAATAKNAVKLNPPSTYH